MAKPKTQTSKSNAVVSHYRFMDWVYPDNTRYSLIDAVLPEHVVNKIYGMFDQSWIDVYGIIPANGKADPKLVVLNVKDMLKLPRKVLETTRQMETSIINLIYEVCLMRMIEDNPDLPFEAVLE